MKKISKKGSRAGKFFVAGCWIIIGVLALGYFTNEKKPETTKPAKAPATQKTDQKTNGIKPRDLTDKDRKIIGECARHLKTLENMFLEFRNTKTFQEYGFSHPDYKEWKITVEKIQQILLKPHDEGYSVLEYTDVYAAACWLHGTAMEAATEAAMGRRKPNQDEKERGMIQRIDENLAPFLDW